ncbi:MAG: sigma-54-dependent transcriptional regulator [Kofleriaceae bacterium]
MPPIRLLVVDDNQEVINTITRKLATGGIEIDVSTEPTAIASKLQMGSSPWDVVLLDVEMPGMSGVALLHLFKESGSMASVVMLSGDTSANTAALCMRAGAFDYLTKPFKPSELVPIVESAARYSRMRRELLGTRVAVGELTDSIMVGMSPQMRQVRSAIDRIAPQSVSVLIQGESGTGKELAAWLLHDRSLRRERPFVVVNCGAIPETLIDGELFGHGDRPGKFVAADGGTLVLDEIADLPLAIQARVLGVLQDGEVRPIGATSSRRVDVRVTALTNTDLDLAVERKRFRKELLYRLNVVTLAIPPLSQRIEDLPLLAAAFLQKHGGATPPTLAPATLDAMTSYHWPGNVRELENALIHAISLRTGDVIGVESLPLQVRNNIKGARRLATSDIPTLTLTEAKRKATTEFERDYLVQIMQRAEGSVAEGARMSGIDRTNFRRLLQRHGIDPAEFKPAAE